MLSSRQDLPLKERDQTDAQHSAWPKPPIQSSYATVGNTRQLNLLESLTDCKNTSLLQTTQPLEQPRCVQFDLFLLGGRDAR
ncbi:hypothetical protein BaRGS_00014768 [Batillaria attramentaria]|uniref:Uncharacterized protein n=1 Tax=Batillaria attramentaria TaxID=370345 RepID=A0ABD0L2Y4_9CAEN